MNESVEATAEAPLLQVVHGNPSAEDVAALTAVVLALGTSEPAPAPRRSTRSWVRRQQLRLQPTPGPGAWRRSRG